MASGAPTLTLGPSILAASSPNINLSTNMASEAISEHLILINFSGGACLRTHHRRCIDNTAVLYYLKYLPPPLHTMTYYLFHDIWLTSTLYFASFSVSVFCVVRFLMYDVICGYSCKWRLERPYHKGGHLFGRVTRLLRFNFP